MVSGIDPLNGNFEASDTMIFVVWKVPIEDIGAPATMGTWYLSITHFVIRVQNLAYEISECLAVVERLWMSCCHRTDP